MTRPFYYAALSLAIGICYAALFVAIPLIGEAIRSMK
jgi:hypothetical protein